MDAAMVIGLMDPQGGKVKRSDYDLRDNDYVIQSGDTVDTVASAMKVPSQLIQDQGSFQPGDVMQGFEGVEGMSKGDVIGKLDRNTINWELMNEVGADEINVFKQMVDDGMDQEEYDTMELEALKSLIQPDIKDLIRDPDGYTNKIKANADMYKIKYPDIFARGQKSFEMENE